MKKIIFIDILSTKGANALLASLAKLPWTRGKQTRGFHRGKDVPRDEIWMGPYPYKFSGRVLNPIPWTPGIKSLLARIRKEARDNYGYGDRDGNWKPDLCDYNSVLLNRYRDEDDGVDWHADDEKEMDPRHPIASVSLGALRKFEIRSNKTREIESILLSSGSLLIMPAGFQQRYEHSVPKAKSPTGERINLTFRHMLPRSK